MNLRRHKFVLVMLMVAMIPITSLTVLSLFSGRPTNLGVINGHLADCQATANCVCTQATDAEHRIEPIHFTGSPDEARNRLKAIITAIPRSNIVAADERYMHVEFASLIFRFVDDVEFLLDPPTKTIHFRSASRVGRSDLGVNRKRMEEIRQKFESAWSSHDC